MCMPAGNVVRRRAAVGRAGAGLARVFCGRTKQLESVDDSAAHVKYASVFHRLWPVNRLVADQERGAGEIDGRGIGGVQTGV